MSEIGARPATREDADAIAQVHVDSWEATFRGVLADEALDARNIDVRRRMWRGRLGDEPLAGEIVVVGTYDGAVKGFAAGDPSDYPDEDPAEILNLRSVYVAPGLEGAGLAPVMHDEFVRQCRLAGWKLISGQIAPENERSSRFFIKRSWWYDGYERTIEDGSTQRRCRRWTTEDGSPWPEGS